MSLDLRVFEICLYNNSWFFVWFLLNMVFRMLRLGPYPPPLIEISDPEDREIWEEMGFESGVQELIFRFWQMLCFCGLCCLSSFEAFSLCPTSFPYEQI